MASPLNTIQPFLQQLVEAIAAVLAVEVMVIDNQLCLRAATGTVEKDVGALYLGSLTEQIIKSGDYHVVKAPREEIACQSCCRKSECGDFAALIYPLIDGERVIGTISLFAKDNEQKKRLLDNQTRLLKFIEKISILLSGVIREKLSKDHLSLVSSQFRAVINSVHEGIIATNSMGEITHCNRSAVEMLSLPADSLIGLPIQEIFPDIKFENFLQQGKIYEQELICSYRRKSHFWGIVTPINQTGQIVGLTISFRKMSEMRKVITRFGGYQAGFTFDQIVGESLLFRDAIEKLKRVAVTDSTILIRGESGTGKELLARAVHSASLRRDGPFVAINCGAIPESLMESELFGYDEGAFTGAKRGGKPGKFEMANGGTLFLDEIGDMPLHLQVKLLRMLEQRSFERVGATEQIHIDVRIIAATHRNLEEMIDHKEFRSDLYYRLSVIPVWIPSLRERGESDIQLLLEHFLKVFSEKLNKPIKGFTKIAMERLLDYHWPGNVRELENAVEYAISMENQHLIQVNNLPSKLLALEMDSASLPRAGQLKNLQHIAIQKALEKFGRTLAGKEMAAKYLGISRATLYRKLKEIDERKPGV